MEKAASSACNLTNCTQAFTLDNHIPQNEAEVFYVYFPFCCSRMI